MTACIASCHKPPTLSAAAWSYCSRIVLACFTCCRVCAACLNSLDVSTMPACCCATCQNAWDLLGSRTCWGQQCSSTAGTPSHTHDAGHLGAYPKRHHITFILLCCCSDCVCVGHRSSLQVLLQFLWARVCTCTWTQPSTHPWLCVSPRLCTDC